nr:ribonuclease H-like domain-containing protein [Tanacetum cinerariifolium]
MPPKRNLKLIDEHFKNESVDISTVSSSADKTVMTIDITHKGVLNTEEPKYFMKNNFGPPIIEYWHSDDDSEDELSPTVQGNDTTARERAVVSGNIGREAEAVNTACYVLNRALVTKPHNKIPYELIRGIPPIIDFMKPFGCPVTILNTRDNLGKFEGKADEGYFVGYSVVIVTGNQTNGIAGTKEKLVAGQNEKKKELEQEYILIPIYTTGPLISQDAKDNAEDARKKAPEVDAGEASDNSGQDNQVSKSEDGSLFQQDRQTEHNNSTNDINIVSSPVSTAGPSFVNVALQIPLNVAGPSASTNAFEEHCKT